MSEVLYVDDFTEILFLLCVRYSHGRLKPIFSLSHLEREKGKVHVEWPPTFPFPTTNILSTFHIVILICMDTSKSNQKVFLAIWVSF